MTGIETTPGRAAEPDTMEQTKELLRVYGKHRFVAGEVSSDEAALDEELTKTYAARDALLSAVRTIVTERDEARTRAETAEAQLQEQSHRAQYAERQVTILEAQLETLGADR